MQLEVSHDANRWFVPRISFSRVRPTAWSSLTVARSLIDQVDLVTTGGHSSIPCDAGPLKRFLTRLSAAAFCQLSIFTAETVSSGSNGLTTQQV